MAKGTRLLPHQTLDRMKWEVAKQEGLTQQILHQGWAETSSRDCGRVGGRIGGRMVKVMIAQAQQAMADGDRLP